MSTRVAVAAGLVAGALAAGALLVALVFLLQRPIESPPTSVRASASVPTATVPSPAASAADGSAIPSAGGGGSTPAPSTAESNFHIGSEAPTLTVAQVGGGGIDLSALRGKPVWVNFMATWCPSCVDELPRMTSYAARYADDDLVVVAVDVGEDEGDVAAYMQNLGVTFPVGLDRDGAAQDRWGAFALPVHFWIDRDGVVRDGALGGIGPDVMARGLRRILPGVDVTT
jgi:cytochrome c biogenesis protein CcmG, thiol:disulfide interchange protein DsbE